MSLLQAERTSIGVRVPTRERITRNAKEERATVEDFLNRLLDKHETDKFWAAMAAAPRPTQQELDEIDNAFLVTANDGLQ